MWVGVFSVGALLPLIVRAGLGLFGALGTDAPLWGLTARDLLAGAPPLVPPMYPATFAALLPLGVSPATGGTLISAVSCGILVVLSTWLARTLDTPHRLAVPVGLASLVLPDVVGWGLQVQPDAMAAAWGVGLALALARLHSSGSKDAAWAVVVVGGLAPLLREHGLVWAAVAMVGLGVGPVPFRRLAWMVPVVMWVGPLLVGVMPGTHPLDVPWSDRAGGALAAFTTDDPGSLSFLHELHRTDRAAYAEFVTANDRLGQLAWHLSRTARLAPDGWVLVGVALGATWLHRSKAAWRVAALPLVAALPALLIWSQRRHVLLVAPLAIVLVAASVRSRRVLLGLGAVVLGVHGAINWPGSIAAWKSETPRARHYAEVGAWLHEHARPGDLLGGVHQDVGLYAPPLPRHDPDGSPADWRTFLVTDRPPPPRDTGTWSRVFRGPQLSIWQLDPTRTPRPCADAPLPAGSAHLAVGRARVELHGCAEP